MVRAATLDADSGRAPVPAVLRHTTTCTAVSGTATVAGAPTAGVAARATPTPNRTALVEDTPRCPHHFR